MEQRQAKVNISQVILSSICPHLLTPDSKLSQLQHVYTSRGLGFKDVISVQGRALTRKIFGTAVKCLSSTQSNLFFVHSKNLVVLSFVLLCIAYKDQYVMKLIINEINQCHSDVEKMFQKYNPYSNLKITAKDFQKVLAQIILKISNWNVLMSMYNNLQEYFVAIQTFSVFLTTFLSKLNYTDSQNLSEILYNTEEVYSIICDYFGLNIICHKAHSLRKKNHGRSANQVELGEKALVTLFNNDNLFISTVDNQQFCFGKYYSNQTQLLKNQNQLSKSTLEYVFSCKQAEEKQIQQEEEENQDKFQIMRGSRLELDLGMSTSGFCPSQGETPFFPSNLPTPEFGGTLDFQFRGSTEFQGVVKLVQNQKQNQIIEQEEIFSPNSDPDRNYSQFNIFHAKNSPYTHQQNQINRNYQSLQIKPTKKSNNEIRKQIQDDQSHNKPRSPPSSQTRRNKNHQRPNTTQDKKQSQSINFKKPIDKKNQNFSDKRIQQQKQSFTSKLKNIETQNSQHFARDQQIQKPTQGKKKKQSLRKYSVHQIISQQSKVTKNKQKNVIHHSNHFNRGNQAPQNQKSANYISYKEPSVRQASYICQNEHSRSEDVQRIKKNQRKMQFTSNIINLQVNKGHQNKNQYQANFQSVLNKRKKGERKFIDINQKFSKYKYLPLNLHPNYQKNYYQHQRSPRTQKANTVQVSSIYGYSSKNNIDSYNQKSKSPRKPENQKKCPQFLKSPKQRRTIYNHQQLGQKKFFNKSIKRVQDQSSSLLQQSKREKASHEQQVVQKISYASNFEKTDKQRSVSNKMANQQVHQTINPDYFIKSGNNCVNNFASSPTLKIPLPEQSTQNNTNLIKSKQTQSNPHLYINSAHQNLNDKRYINYENCNPQNWQYFGQGMPIDENRMVSFEYGLAHRIPANQNSQRVFIRQVNHVATEPSHTYFSNINPTTRKNQPKLIHPHTPQTPQNLLTKSTETTFYSNNHNFYQPQNNMYLSCERQRFNTAASSTVLTPTPIKAPSPQIYYEYENKHMHNVNTNLSKF